MLNQRIPQIFTLIHETLQAHFKYKKEEDVSFQMRPLCLVIRLGLEPKTPTLKVLCSTC